tara:strand:- start:315498 stop:316184 length:687 start_codon:yes stop_codon:yes gene_type:complete
MIDVMRVLAVDDEEDLVELLRYSLTSAGFDFSYAYTGEDALEKVFTNPPDLMLLDLMLPGIDGLGVCKKIRNSKEISQFPIIMITAKGTDEDIVKGLELGADDYVVKPFSPKVLLARVRASLRRVEESLDTKMIVSSGDLSIDRERFQVKIGSGSLNLTKSELFILEVLMVNQGKVNTRKQIISVIRQGEITVTERSVDVHITSLRKKLGKHGEKLLTVRGIGYRFDG